MAFLPKCHKRDNSRTLRVRTKCVRNCGENNEMITQERIRQSQKNVQDAACILVVEIGIRLATRFSDPRDGNLHQTIRQGFVQCTVTATHAGRCAFLWNRFRWWRRWCWLRPCPLLNLLWRGFLRGRLCYRRAGENLCFGDWRWCRLFGGSCGCFG